MNRKSSSSPVHPRWLVLVVVLLIGYGLLQPIVNSRWGWKLPSLKSLVSDASDATDNTTSETLRDSGFEPEQTSEAEDGELRASTHGGGIESVPSNGTISSKSQNDASKLDASPTEDQLSEDLVYGLLRKVRRDEFVSPAGLRYTRGSEEGHRLDHLARHLEDKPDRPGRHGVFNAEMRQVLVWLDEAFNRANRRAKGTTTRLEDGRTVIEVTFTEPIGFIGGREGGRQGNPESKRLRMVLDSERVITAFPF